MPRMTEQEYQAIVTRGRAVLAVDRIAHRIRHPEDELQRAVCQYWAAKYPSTWECTFHPPNGLAAKSPKLAAIFQGLGVKPGVFDLICIARRGRYTGFALELKSQHGTVSENQSSWQTRFIEQGWYTGFAFTLDSALATIEAYHYFPPYSESP